MRYLAIIYAWTGEKDRAIKRLSEGGETSGRRDELRSIAAQSALGSAAR